MNKRIVIVAAKRTAVGNFMGSLSSYSASKIGGEIIKNIIESTKNSNISEVIMGQVLTTACGQNPSRQSTLESGLGYSVPAYTINKVCGSGLKSVCLAAQSISLGDASCIIAGGQESMSNSPHSVYLRKSKKMGDAKIIDTMVFDGLTDYFNNYHMGLTAENLAKKYEISRKEQDEFALESQKKSSTAKNNGFFKDEILPIGDFCEDEFIKPETTMETLAKLKPAFIKDSGTVTAGNASGINDGAAAVMIMSEEEAMKKNLEPIAYIEAFASSGVEPEIMGIGPVEAINKTLQKANLSIEDIDIIELNEAFAAQSIAVLRELKPKKPIVNIYGGAISIGHPIGASGTRCLVTLLYAMKRNNFKLGLVSLCIGGGMGIAMCLSRK